MEVQKEISGMLEQLLQPGFCVIDQKIIALNAAARGLFLTAGTDIGPLLLTGAGEYAAFQGGCLYLTLRLGEQPRGAVVTRVGKADVFLLDPDCGSGELRSLALAAQELRKPLSGVMATLDSLAALPQTEASAGQLAALNRGLYQLLRVVGNMSDAGRSYSRQETQNIGALLEEIFEKAAHLCQKSGISLRYEGLGETIYCPADGQQLERAVLNLLSNALKFTPAGGTIDAVLTRQGRMLRLSIRDSGSGIARELRSNLFTRYLRQPAIEDSRYGLGLGLVLVRSAATAHGGTVLIDQPGETGTRVTLTLAIRQNPEAGLRSPILRVDYAGERDHALLELADCLPEELYQLH